MSKDNEFAFRVAACKRVEDWEAEGLPPSPYKVRCFPCGAECYATPEFYNLIEADEELYIPMCFQCAHEHMKLGDTVEYPTGVSQDQLDLLKKRISSLLYHDRRN